MVCDFNLPIGLWVCGRGVVILNTQFRAEIPKCNIVKLLSVVGDKYSGYLKSVDNVSPNKTSNVLRDSG